MALAVLTAKALLQDGANSINLSLLRSISRRSLAQRYAIFTLITLAAGTRFLDGQRF